jgi:hypothetical protein
MVGRALIALACVRGALIAAGIVAALGAWYFSPVRQISERVENAHLAYVELVDYNLNPIYPAESVWIYLSADTTDAEISDLYCRIVTPTAVAQVRFPGHFGMTKGVTWWPRGVDPRQGGNHGFSGGKRVSLPSCP